MKRVLNWRIVDACPALDQDGFMCEGERGHAPAPEGGHWNTDWSNGQPVGPLYWDSEVSS